MGRLLGGAAAVLIGAMLVGLVPAPGPMADAFSAFSAFTGSVVGSAECKLAMADGSSRAVPPSQAATVATAAVTGQSVDPTAGVPADLDPAAVALGTAAAVSCRIPSPSGLAVQAQGPIGLTPRAALLRDEVRAAFGAVPDGGFAPAGVTTGHGPKSAHYQGRAVDFFFRPYDDPANRAQGWALANWLVANAQRLEIAVVIFDDQIWSTRRSAQGWRAYSNPTGATDPISRHLDHVHVDVIEGR